MRDTDIMSQVHVSEIANFGNARVPGSRKRETRRWSDTGDVSTSGPAETHRTSQAAYQITSDEDKENRVYLKEEQGRKRRRTGDILCGILTMDEIPDSNDPEVI